MTQNLLFIFSDQHQSTALSCAGHPYVKTPNLDRLAARGQRMTSAYTPCPICVPARASVQTGRHVHETGCWDNAMPYTGTPTGWAHDLAATGMPVESIGKLHFRNVMDDTGFTAQTVSMHVKDGIGMLWGSVRDPMPPRREDVVLFDYIGAGHSSYNIFDEAVTEAATARLRELAASGQRFFLQAGYVAPHFPLVVPQKYMDMYPEDALPLPDLMPRDGYVRHPWVETMERFFDTDGEFGADDALRRRAISAYFGLCSFLDDQVGRLLGVLEETGLAETTTVIYSSDHGEDLGKRGRWGKSHLYREATEVPLIVARPGERPGTCDTPVSLIDLAPTFLQHFGLSDDSLPGKSLFDIIDGAPAPDRVAFSEYHAVGAESAGYMIRKGPWKYHYYVGFAPELFDLRSDPDEAVNLAGDPAHAARLAEMEAELRRICDPEATDRRAKADQAALVERHGGREAAYGVGPTGATPAEVETGPA